MVNFEMYQVSAWSNQGLTQHVTKVVKSYEATLKTAVKNALIAGSIIATVFANVPSNDLSIQASSILVIKHSPSNENGEFSAEFVPVGFWPKLIENMNQWKVVVESPDIFNLETLV